MDRAIGFEFRHNPAEESHDTLHPPRTFALCVQFRLQLKTQNFLSLRIRRQRKIESRPLAHFALRPNPAAVALDDVFDDGQP